MNHEQAAKIIEWCRPMTVGELQDELDRYGIRAKLIAGPEPGVLRIIDAHPDSEERSILLEGLKNRLPVGVFVEFDDTLEGLS